MSRPEERVPLILRDICADCAEPLYTGEWKGKPWFTCSTCGQAVCEDCRRKHIMLCMAKAWGAVTEGPGGELIEVDRPRQAAIR